MSQVASTEAREQEHPRARLELSQETLSTVSLDKSIGAGSSSGMQTPGSVADIADREAGPEGMWREALQELEMQMTRATFDTWLKPARLLAWVPADPEREDPRTRVVIGAPDEYVKDWLEHRLCTPIRRTLSGIAGQQVEVDFRAAG